MTSLINCTLCNKEISNHANICPSCGHPIEKLRKEAKDNKQTFLIAIVVLLFIGVILLDQKGVIDLKSIAETFGLSLS